MAYIVKVLHITMRKYLWVTLFFMLLFSYSFNIKAEDSAKTRTIINVPTLLQLGLYKSVESISEIQS